MQSDTETQTEAAKSPDSEMAFALELAKLENAAFLAPVCHQGSRSQLASLYAALAAAQGEFGVIEKNRTGTITHRDSTTGIVMATEELRYADLQEITAKTRPALSKHGLATIQPVGPAKHGGGLALFTQLIHAEGGILISEIPLNDKMLAGDVKNMGSLLTYLRRYAKSSILDVSADDDIDQSSERSHQPERQAHRQVTRQADPEVLPAEETQDYQEYQDPKAGEVRTVVEETVTDAPNFYSEDEFAKLIPGWVGALKAGRSASFVISVASAKKRLTEHMVAAIQQHEAEIIAAQRQNQE